MSRVSMVTRTVTTTTAEIMCLNVTTGIAETQKIVLTGTYKDDQSVLKSARPLLENDTVKVVHVVSTTENETLYGMTEQEFIETAKPLPPRVKKEAEEKTDEERTDRT